MATRCWIAGDTDTRQRTTRWEGKLGVLAFWQVIPKTTIWWQCTEGKVKEIPSEGQASWNHCPSLGRASGWLLGA